MHADRAWRFYMMSNLAVVTAAKLGVARSKLTGKSEIDLRNISCDLSYRVYMVHVSEVYDSIILCRGAYYG